MVTTKLARRLRTAGALLGAATLLWSGSLPVASAQSADRGQGLGLNPGSRASDAAQDDSGAADGRYYVEFARFGAGAASVRAAGGRVVHEFPQLGVVAAQLPPQAVASLQNNPNVRSIEADPRRYPQATWNDTPADGNPQATEVRPYGLAMVQADQLADAQAGTRKVCVIDSGYSMDHADLPDGSKTHQPGALYPGGVEPLVYGSWDTGTGNWYEDGYGHGTHVAGTIAAIGGNGLGVPGVNPGGRLRLHIVRVFGDDGNWAYSSDLVAALDRCREYGSNVVNMSLGGTWSSTWENSAFQGAYNAGVLPVAAAGNAGNTRTTYPAGYGSVVSVAAVDANEVAAGFSQRNADVELAAPGVQVLSTVPFRESNTVAVNGTAYYGTYIDGAARTTGAVSGVLADGGTCNTAVTDGSWAGKVVLCARDGTVSFATKVGNVQGAGGAAAVVSNHEDGPLSGTLNGASTIPAIGVTKADGTALRGVLGQGASVLSQAEKPASGYERWDGTSMATPHVAGVAALVWSHNPAWTNAQVREALQRTARDKGTAGRDSTYGYGIVQAKAAYDYLVRTYGGGGTDSTPPTGTIAINNGAAYATGTSVTLTLSASDGAGSGVAEMQFSNNNGTWGTFEPYASSKAYTLPAGDGAKTVYARFKDGAGNVSAAVSDGIVLDTTAPTVTANQAAGQEDSTSASPIAFSVVFSEPVTGFAAADVSFDGSTATGMAATVTGSGDGRTFTVAVSGMTAGAVQVSVPDGAATDAAGHTSAASTSTDNSVTYEGAPTPTVPGAPTGLTAKAVGRNGSRIDLAWTDNATNETGYRVERSTDRGATFSVIAQLGANTTVYSDSATSRNTTYTYRVVAFNAAGDSARSNPATASTR